MDYETAVANLASEDWLKSVGLVEAKLRKEMLGTKSIIREIKESDEVNRKAELDTQAATLRSLETLDGLDEEIQRVTDQWLQINTRYANRLYVDYVTEFRNHKNIQDYPAVAHAIEIIRTQGENPILQNRLSAILAKVVGASLGQANKSNAGTAGETLVRSVFEAAGLANKVHFREQYKSKAGGSDADFVFPNVEDFRDFDLEVVVAVQFSSNDRARMSTSEMKAGAQNYAVTGNGLSASSKKLSSIGKEIIAGLKSENVRMVCYDKEIKRELDRLNRKIKNPKNAAELSEVTLRKEYFDTLAISFEAFAKRLQIRFCDQRLSITGSAQISQ